MKIIFILFLAALAGAGIYGLFLPVFGPDCASTIGALIGLIIFAMIAKSLFGAPPCTACGDSRTFIDNVGVVRCLGCTLPRQDLNR